MSVVQLQEEIIEIPKDHEKYNERVAVLCIAYHNLGVELEFLKRVNFTWVPQILQGKSCKGY